MDLVIWLPRLSLKTQGTFALTKIKLRSSPSLSKIAFSCRQGILAWAWPGQSCTFTSSIAKDFVHSNGDSTYQSSQGEISANIY